MNYYDPIDHTSRLYAAIATVVIMAAGALLLGLVTIDVRVLELQEPPLEIQFIEEEPLEPPKQVVQETKPQTVRADYAPAHTRESVKEQSVETQGKQEATQTINPNALFKPVAGNAEETPAGNRLAPEGEKETSKGDGEGYNLQGSDQLDAGLQGRGLREGLPKPNKSFNTAGRVVVYVTIDSAGNVVSAKVDLVGTTTSDETLRRLAVEAALKAKFKPSQRTAQGGRITYDFKLQ